MSHGHFWIDVAMMHDKQVKLGGADSEIKIVEIRQN